MGELRTTLGAALIVGVLVGCAAQEPTVTTDPEPAPTVAAEKGEKGEGREQTDGTDPSDRPGKTSRGEGGARFEVPDAVILEQLRRAAERIAQNYTAPPTPTPPDIDPGTNRALGYQLMLDFGFAEDQWQYLDQLWIRESGWNHLADNPTSSAYGIPQSLPGSKMAVVGPDWRTNPETQIRWGLAYIAARYGNPERAWAHSERHNWY